MTTDQLISCPDPELDADPEGSDENLLELRAKRFCLVFLATVVLGLLSVVLANLVVNPFAQYSSHYFQPVVQTSRATKIALFDEFCQTGPPQALILGSSRVQKFEPSYVEKLTGLRCFNAGVNYGSTEDYLAWFRYFRKKTGDAPKLLILGIDVAGFSEATRPDARLLGCRVLAQELGDVLTVHDRLHPYRDLLDLSQTRQTLRSLNLHARGRVPQPEEHYCADGLLIYDRRESELAEGTYDFEAPLTYTIGEYQQKFRGFGRVSDEQIHVLEMLFAECQQGATDVIAFYTTSHPRHLAALRAATEYDRHFASVDTRLQNTFNAYGFRLFDLRQLQQYDGDAGQFVDGIHPLESNTRRMLDVMFSSGMNPSAL